MKKGDVVRLPSGSAAMTVLSVGQEDVDVCWMGYEDKLLHKATLPKEAVVADEPESKNRGKVIPF